jgi:DNA-binding PadR family transcriptional regulator
MPPIKLSLFGQEVLTAIRELGDNAYGVTIQETLEEKHGRDVSYGRLHVTLQQLEQTGWIEGRWGEATEERGWRRKRYYRIVERGDGRDEE